MSVVKIGKREAQLLLMSKRGFMTGSSTEQTSCSNQLKALEVLKKSCLMFEVVLQGCDPVRDTRSTL